MNTSPLFPSAMYLLKPDPITNIYRSDLNLFTQLIPKFFFLFWHPTCGAYAMTKFNITTSISSLYLQE